MSVFTRSSASKATPCFFAKPSAAGVGSPAALNAADTGGPVIVSSRSSWRSGMRPMRAVRRRGVLKLSTATSGVSRISFSRACSFSDELLRQPRQPGGRQLFDADFEEKFAIHYTHFTPIP